VLQWVAVCCSVLQCVAVAFRTLDSAKVHVSEMYLYAAVCCSVLQCVAVAFRTLENAKVHVSEMHLYVAVCCIVLQCVAVCCSVFQWPSGLLIVLKCM